MWRRAAPRRLPPALWRRRAAAAAAAAGVGVGGGLGLACCGAAVVAASASDDPDGDGLHLWLQQRGATVAGVQFRRCADDASKGRGAFLRPGADRSSDRGLLLRLPRNLVLTAERAMEAVPALRALRAEAEAGALPGSPLAAALADARSGPPLLLTLFVLHGRISEGAEHGEWADYVAALPFTFDTPSLWPRNSAAAACIEGTPLDDAVLAKRRWLSHLREALPPALRQAGGEMAALADALDAEPDGGEAALGWADAVVWSRGVAVPREGGDAAPDTPGGALRKWEVSRANALHQSHHFP